jgi:hypothetical protein
MIVRAMASLCNMASPYSDRAFALPNSLPERPRVFQQEVREPNWAQHKQADLGQICTKGRATAGVERRRSPKGVDAVAHSSGRGNTIA